MKPLVSIVTPVFNCRRHLPECIDSVVGQNYARIEHVLVDGGSTDGTLDILQGYADRFPGRVRFVSEPDGGPGDAWGKGLRLASGDIFGCIGADDYCAPGAVRAVVHYFETHSDAFFVHGDCDFLYENGEIVRYRPEPFDLKAFINTARHIATPAAYYRRAVLERVGWLGENADDFDLMIRIGRGFEIHQIARVLATLRIRQNSAFNPVDSRKRVAVCRQTYRVSRTYGGALFSPIAQRYYVAVLSSCLHLDPYMPLLRRAVRRVWPRRELPRPT